MWSDVRLCDFVLCDAIWYYVMQCTAMLCNFLLCEVSDCIPRNIMKCHATPDEVVQWHNAPCGVSWWAAWHSSHHERISPTLRLVCLCIASKQSAHTTRHSPLWLAVSYSRSHPPPRSDPTAPLQHLNRTYGRIVTMWRWCWDLVA